MFGIALPQLLTSIPGPQSRAAVERLGRLECPAITSRRARRATSLGASDDDPIVWQAARGANVRDVDSNVFVDLTSGFGVALVGHRDPEVVAAAHAQSERLVHAMGDAWPDATRIDLLEDLAEAAPPGLSVSILGLSGSDAVDAAVKTARLHTNRPGVLTFDGGYHGLALGVLALQGYRSEFTAPFSDITHPHVRRLPWGAPASDVRRVLGGGEVGLVLMEPILGRGGIHAAPSGWLAEVAAAARDVGALVAHDEIQTGLGRTGVPFAGAGEGVVPDLLCVGKALGGGFPLSACIGTVEAMHAWGASTGEAIHTQTFLGHPVGCAAGRVVLRRLRGDLCSRVERRGRALTEALTGVGRAVRGRGLMRAVTVSGSSLVVARGLLRRGFLVLPAGPNSLGLTPPVTLADAQIAAFVDALQTEDP